jgi:hypothetical protein
MKRSLQLFLITAVLSVGANIASGSEYGFVYLYGYMNMKVFPITKAEIIEVEPRLIKIKYNGREISHAGGYSIIQPRPKKGFWSKDGEKAEMVILYGFMGMDMFPLGKAEVIKTKNDLIIVDSGKKRYSHSGRYQIQK